MTKIETNKFRRILQSMVIDLESATRQRDAIVIEKSAEPLESVLWKSEREVAMRKLEGEFVKLREARAALRRIDEGTFGTCEECEEPISPRRLAAMPTAALCIRCKESEDCNCGATNVRTTFAMAA